jgi:hypothetical protein
MDALPLSTRKWRHAVAFSSPASSASCALILLSTRADLDALSSAEAPRPSSTVTSAPPVLRG